MFALAIECSSPRSGLALAEIPLGSKATDILEADIPSVRFNEDFFPILHGFLAKAGKTIKDLGMIAVDTGPGSFTGLRMGLATAKTLAQALRIPLAVFSSIAVIMEAVPGDEEQIAVAIDARRNQIFLEIYNKANGSAQLSEGPFLWDVDQTLDWLSKQANITIAGTAVPILREAATQSGIRWSKAVYPRARALLEMASREILPEWQTLFRAEPVYWRQPDAATLKERGIIHP